MSDGATRVAVVFEQVARGSVQVVHGHLKEPPSGAFALDPGRSRLSLVFDEVHLARGANSSRVSLALSDGRAFTFFLRDVSSQCPILVPDLGIAVVPEEDERSYGEVLAQAKIASPQETAEESFENACRFVRDQACPVWLGLGRDMRIFRVFPEVDGASGQMGYWGRIEPWNHSMTRDGGHAVRYHFVLGRGANCSIDVERRLEEGHLPILRSLQRDGEVLYDLTAFATLEEGPLSKEAVRGTHPVAALANTLGAMLTADERARYEQMKEREVLARESELVCWVRATALNNGAVPRYAYFRGLVDDAGSRYDHSIGCSVSASGEAIALNLLEGEPMPQREMAVLLQPGQTVTLDLLVPHRPISLDRAKTLGSQSFDRHRAECIDFWKSKLAAGAEFAVPEPAIDNRIKAGLTHLDVNTLGLATDGHLLATVGWYSPIGSESSPMIQFYDSMGWHDVAERCIQFFLDRQAANGFIQTFGGYQLETGPVLWTAGEHFRYTRDEAWARRILPQVKAACEYLLDWRKRNLREDLRRRGYGLLDGKVADPEDFFHSFMLNGLSYLGLKRVAEMYRHISPQFASELESEVRAYRDDIRQAYAENVAASPAVPLGDGTWSPSFGPWAEHPGPVSLYAEGGDWFTHGAFASRDTLIGALYLGICEVLEPSERLADWLLASHRELMTHRNAGFSQPYYCRHDWLHLKRGEVKAYLKTYYNQVAALQDRSTLTFWEHYYGVSQQKTHEEGWFLMQTRWMLWDEDYESRTLRLLPMVPRAWLREGEEIRLRRCRSYFGTFDLTVRSMGGRIDASFQIDLNEPQPITVNLRLPSPTGESAREINGGSYDAATESIRFDAVDRAFQASVVF